MQSKIILKNIIEENSDKSSFYVHNLLREYLQVLILDFIYSSKEYKELFFYGGTCLFHLYNLPRLSEDLDFVDVKKKINIKELAKDVKVFLENKTGFLIDAKVQKFRIYFKFPILRELGFSKEKLDSDYLFVKVEIFSDFNFCNKFKEEFKTIFKFNHSIIVKTFDISTLMATKIRAILYRNWKKVSKEGKVLAKVKGRDFFDLMWFLEREIEPNLSCIENIKSKKELKEIILSKLENADARSISFDLKNFITNNNFNDDIGEKIKKIIENNIKKW